MTSRRLSVAIAAVLVAAGCAAAPPKPQTAPAHLRHPLAAATASLAPASGTLVSGRLALTSDGDGVRIAGDIGGLGPGSTHGIHVHERGDCSAADASSAGGHFNPAGAAHGRAGSAAHHLGDIDNIVADASGVAHVSMRIDGAILGTGGDNDILGRAIVVHANPDDYATQPSGNSGPRVACGVIQMGMVQTGMVQTGG